MRVHEASMLVAIVVALVRTVLLAADRAPRRAIAGAALVVGGMVVAWATWPFVRWDQIGLVAVTVGTGLRGLWWPAFEDEVRFLLIGGAEVSPTTYGWLLLVHLGAPILAPLAILASWPRRRRTAGTDEVEVDDQGIPIFDLG